MRWLDEENGMKCPNCGQDNLDFKMFCGFCGTELKGFSEKTQISVTTDNQTSSQEVDMQQRLLNRKLINSGMFGFFFRILPILLSVLAYILTSYLVEINEISSPYLLVVFSLILLSLMLFAGSIIFNEGWSLESMESPIKGVIAVLLCASLLFVGIFGSIAIFDSTSQYRFHEPINTNAASISGAIENWKIDSTSETGISGHQSGLVIKNILFHASDRVANSYSGIDLYHAIDCQIENCIFIDLSTGVKMTNCSDVVIRNCIFSATFGIVLLGCKNIDIVNCEFSDDFYLYSDNNCSNINDEFNSVKNTAIMPQYSDFLFPPLAAVAEAILVLLFIIWLFLFGWLRGIRPNEP